MSEPRGISLLLNELNELLLDGTVIVNDDAELRRLAERLYNCGAVAPPEADREELDAAIESVVIAALNCVPGDPRYHDHAATEAALAECKNDLRALFVAAAPEDGRPTYAELVDALDWATTRLQAALRNAPVRDSDEVLSHASALLSRIPKEV